jgi:DNA-binding MarR family transcriptional regulator
MTMLDLPEPDNIDFLLGQICKLHHARAHTLLEDLGLYRGQPPMLHALWEQEGLTHSELAVRLHVQPATITKMIQRMEKAGFVERRDDPEDQRVSRVYLSEAGHAIRAKVEQVWHQLGRETFAGLTPEEQETLYRLLRIIRQNLLYVYEEAPHPKH